MADRPYLTSAEAATYCGFKTIGGIQQAVRRGKLKPAGRRGGTGTYVFAKEDLDAFLTGGLQPHERLFVPPELNEAARVAASNPALAPAPAPASARPRSRPAPVRAPSPPLAGQPSPRPSSPPEAALSAEAPAAPRASKPSPPPSAEPAAKAPRPAARPSPKTPPARGRKPAAKDDPVARIVQALSGAARKLEKNSKRSR